ncbi:MAG: EutP/PduV family microcompartment system protein, partial [Clostridiales bacterium]|nr:EutP/PduV family microcompartment system protein [Clostridiales bacterium]
EYKKTQALEYYEDITDTPGEYLENRRFYNALIVASHDCDIIALLQDSSDKRCVFPPNFSSIFTKPIVGIITKIDLKEKDIEFARNCLQLAGAEQIFEISSVEGIGLEKFKKYIATI